MPKLNFTVDAELLRELGERLVGRPHMALAELIKNSYDADARTVVITFTEDEIRVVDDGHGMDESTFINRWMRIGTAAKVRQEYSPALRRRLTGSKGVGRLSVQLLARELKLSSTALISPTATSLRNRAALASDQRADQIDASINWPEALAEDEIHDVLVDFETSEPTAVYANDSQCGTSITLRGLIDKWGPTQFRRLAREIWALQPPFDADPSSPGAFSVVLESNDEKVAESFSDQMTKIFDIASAQIDGRLLAHDEEVPRGARTFPLPDNPSTVGDGESAGSTELVTDGASVGRARDVDSGTERAASSEFSRSTPAPARRLLVQLKLAGSPRAAYVVDIPDCQIEHLDYKALVFDLINRQPEGVKVGTARGYLRQYGGVHIYDNGFHLEYYGPDQDWLRVEIDHARRLSRSDLVPQALQVQNALQDLPTNSRVFGAANISTSVEQASARAAGRRPSDALDIQVTRDRLADNRAFDQLRRAVRVGLDLYAIEKARSKVRDVTARRRNRPADPGQSLEQASAAVEGLKQTLPQSAYNTLRDSLAQVAGEHTARRREAQAYAALLGALATAGMTSLAYEHEISKQRAQVQDVARRLQRLARDRPDDTADQLTELAQTLTGWADRAEKIRALFRPLLDEESRTSIASFQASKLVAEVVRQMAVLAGPTQVDSSGVPHALSLPEGGYAAWSAVVQNLLTNAFRATHGHRPALVSIEAGRRAGRGWLRVSDNGDGVELAGSERLFEPFERAAAIDRRAEALGLGGSGLGLTIVRMILDEIGASVQFVSPGEGWSTAVEIEWKEARG